MSDYSASQDFQWILDPYSPETRGMIAEFLGIGDAGHEEPVFPESQMLWESLGEEEIVALYNPQANDVSEGVLQPEAVVYNAPWSPDSQAFFDSFAKDLAPEQCNVPATLWRPWETESHNEQGNDAFVLDDWQLQAMQPLSPLSQAVFDAVAGSPVAVDELCPSVLPEVQDVRDFEDQAWQDATDVAQRQQAIAWIPQRGTGALKRSLEQTGGAVQSSLIVAEEVYHEPQRSAFGGLLVEDAVCVRLKHNLHEIEDLLSAARGIDSAISSIVEPLIADARDEDYVALSIEHPDLDSAGGMRLCYVHKRNFNPQSFLDSIYRWVQSNSTQFLMDGRMVLRVSVLRNAVGHGPKLKAPRRVESYFDPKRSIVTIRNTGSECGWLALTLGKIMADNPNMRTKDRNEWLKLTREGSRSLRKTMVTVFEGHNVNSPLCASKFTAVQETLGGYQLIVIKRPGLSAEILCPMKPLWIGAKAEKTIMIELHDGHFNVIRSLEGYFEAKDGFCRACWKKVDSRKHKCSGVCRKCGASPACLEDATNKQCDGCLMDFANDKCMQQHACGKKWKKCVDCEVEYNVTEGHKCGTYECHHCKEEYTVSPHYCFLDPLDKQKLKEEDQKCKVTVCFDIEARLVPLDERVLDHRANLVIAHTLCDMCAPGMADKNGDCENCGSYKHQYFGDDCVTKFVDYVMEDLAKKVEKKSGGRIHVFSHNAKGYDHRFVMQELFKRDFVNMEPVMQGSKVLKIDVGNVRFQDSMAFLPMALSQIPNAMGWNGDELRKGFFPHLFNKEENYGLKDAAWPPLESYDPGSLKEGARADFLKWYETAKNGRFDFMAELVSYCEMDVKILMFGVRQFRELFLGVSTVDPITRCFTLAGVAFEYFRAMQLEKMTIGITPQDGYLGSGNWSAAGKAWLDLVEKEKGVMLAREQRIGKYTADGFYENTVYEYLGCYAHGCPSCYPDPDEVVMGGQKANEANAKVAEKMAFYSRKGLNVVAVWGCDQSFTKNPYFKMRKQFWLDVKGHEGPRSALAGGRTENFKLMHKCEAGESLKYLDVVSMYPYVLKTRSFPVGHAEAISEVIDYEPGKYFGFVFAKVVPPKDLLIPVLPYHSGGKLLFPLCRTCSEEQKQESCTHSEDKRALESLFVSAELDLALKFGYKLLEVKYVLHYKDRSDGMFAGYVDAWLKIKLEKSGWPDGCDSAEKKEEYVKQTERQEGIRIDAAAVEKNPGLRMIAKLMLNSLWGRLAMKGNMWQSKVVSSYQDMMTIVADEKKEVMPVVILPGERSVLVTWRFREEADARQGKTSPAIAAFVTAYGRMKLYELMAEVESSRSGRCCYADTDSVIFVHEEGKDPEIPIGSLLGELTDEAAGQRIVRGVFAGPKSYCYVTEDKDGNEKNVIKAKGVTLNADAKVILTAEVMEELVESFAAGNKKQVMVPQQQFYADRRTQDMRSRRFVKMFQVTSTKRRVMGTATVPYGWVSM